MLEGCVSEWWGFASRVTIVHLPPLDCHLPRRSEMMMNRRMRALWVRVGAVFAAERAGPLDPGARMRCVPPAHPRFIGMVWCGLHCQ